MSKRSPRAGQLPSAPVNPPSVGASRPIAVLLLLFLGALLWLALGNGRGIGITRWLIVALTAVAATLPPVGNAIYCITEKIRRPSPRAIDWTALLIGIISAAYFIVTAFAQDRDLFPKTHDDCSYAIGMQMLARGHLWMPPLPLPDFFESFYILVKPAYCSKYFPGTALFFVPTVWLHWPTWLLPAIASGTCVALVYRIVTEIIDGACGALAALMMVSLSWFRMLSVMLLSNVPMLLFALLLYWAWMRWRKNHAWGWALAMGAFAGWGAITRPIDAIIVSLPVAIAVVYELARGKSSRRNARMWATTIFAAIAGAVPFLALQIIFNVGVTGRVTETPYEYYIQRFQPNTAYGFHALDPNATVRSSLPQKQEYYQKWVKTFIFNHRPANIARAWATKYLPMIVDTTMQCRLLLVFVPIGLLGLCGIRRWVLWATLPVFIALYIPSTFFLEHYCVLVAPAVILAILLGGRELARAWPRYERLIFAAFTMIVVEISLTSLWELNHVIVAFDKSIAQALHLPLPGDHSISDETFRSPMLRLVNEFLPQKVHLPAVVLFPYHAGGNFFAEPVYNTDVAWPDDAPIIRAHDLGARNHEIFAYYAKVSPQRTFYIFDFELLKQQQDPLIELGTAAHLAAEGH
jgi:hypothetical protein